MVVVGDVVGSVWRKVAELMLTSAWFSVKTGKKMGFLYYVEFFSDFFECAYGEV